MSLKKKQIPHSVRDDTKKHICTSYQSTRSITITRSSLSISFRRTSIISASVVSTVRPMKLASTGKFAMAAVNQHAKPDAARAAQIEEAVHRGAHCAAGVEHVVDEQQVAVVNRERDFARLHYGLRGDRGQIVAVKGDIERAHGNLRFGRGANRFCKAFGERNATTPNAYKRQVLGTARVFDDFMGQTFERAANLVC